MRWRQLLWLCLLWLLPVQAVHAAPPTTLFLLRDIQQSLGLSYRFDGTQADNYSAYLNRAEEAYNFYTEYAVVSPRILNGRFNASFTLKQEDYSSDSPAATGGFDSGFGFFYDLRGVVYDRKPVSLNFFVSSEAEDVLSTFGSNYTLYTDNQGLSLVFNNRYLPGSLNYTHSTSESRGAVGNPSTEVELFSAHFRNDYRLSSTQLHFFDRKERHFSSAARGDRDEDSTELFLRNDLTWESRGLARSLGSTLKLEDVESIDNYQHLDWTESLAWQFGKALKSSLKLSYDKLEGDRRNTETREGLIWLQQQLFSSLTTQVFLRKTDQKFDPGFEKGYSGRLVLAYNKRLPRSSSLNFHVYNEYGVTERDVPVGYQPSVEESYTVEPGAPPVLLANVDVDAASILVRNPDPLIPDYLPGIDYRVEQIGNRTWIVVNEPGLSNLIVAGTELSIYYRYALDTRIEYATNTRGGSAELRLYDGLYRVYAGYDESKPELLSSSDTNLNLSSQVNYRLGFEVNREHLNYSLEYGRFQSDSSGTQILSGAIRYFNDWKGSRFSWYLKDRHQMYDDFGDDQNVLSLGADLRTHLINSGILFLRADYQETLLGADTRRFVLGADFSWRYRKLVLSLKGEVGFRDYEGSRSTQERLRFDVTRYF